MAQQVIDGILYSPVNANSLRHGDLVRLTFDAARILGTPRWVTDDGDPHLIADARNVLGDTTWLKFWPNEPVLRAVGGTAGGLL